MAEHDEHDEHDADDKAILRWDGESWVRSNMKLT